MWNCKDFVINKTQVGQNSYAITGVLLCLTLREILSVLPRC
jgi:hypothetical protein